MNLSGEEAGQHGISPFHKHLEKLRVPGGQTKLPQLVRGRQGTDVADPLEKSHVFTAGEFPLVEKAAFTSQQGLWKPGMGAGEPVLGVLTTICLGIECCCSYP